MLQLKEVGRYCDVVLSQDVENELERKISNEHILTDAEANRQLINIQKVGCPGLGTI